MKCEIFDKWWEYFLVIYWGFFRPQNKKLMGKGNVTKAEFQTKYENIINNVIESKNSERINEFKKFVDTFYKDEFERKKIIESKSHTLIGQTSIAITLLLALVSISTAQLDYLPIIFKISICLMFVLIILNFMTIGLHARNAVILKDGYSHYNEEVFAEESKFEYKILEEKFYCSKYNEYLNNIKATYLKFAHWYYKFSFFLILIAAIMFCILILLNNKQIDNKNNNEDNVTILLNNPKFILNNEVK